MRRCNITAVVLRNLKRAIGSILLVFILIEQSPHAVPISAVLSPVDAYLFCRTDDIDVGTPEAAIHLIQGFDSHDFISGDYCTAIDRVTRVQFVCLNTPPDTIIIRYRKSAKAVSGSSLIISINGKRVGSAPSSDDWHDYELTVNERTIHPFTNVLTIETPKETASTDIFFDLDLIRFMYPDRNSPMDSVIKHIDSQNGWFEIPNQYGIRIENIVQSNDTLFFEMEPELRGFISGTLRSDGIASHTFHVFNTVLDQKLVDQYQIKIGPSFARSETAIQLTVTNEDNGDPRPIRIRFLHKRTSDGSPKPTQQPVLPIKPKPNVIVFVLDSLRADALSAYGQPNPYTPNLDRVSQLGYQFSNDTSAAPYTTSSTASLMTGVEPEDHQVFKIGQHIPDYLPTLAEKLSAAGYTTAAISTMPSIAGEFGFKRGFDHYIELYDSAHYAVDVADVASQFQKLIDVLSIQKPFFLYVHIREPHLPYTPPAPYNQLWSDYQPWMYLMDQSVLSNIITRRKMLDLNEINALKVMYHSGVRYVDTYIGLMIRLLMSHQLWDQAIVTITSDHGEAFYEHSYMFHNETVYQEMISVPLLLTGNALQMSRSLIDPIPWGTTKLHHLIDSLPTQHQIHLERYPESRKWIQSTGLTFEGPIAYYMGHLKFIGKKRLFWLAEIYDLNTDPEEQTNIAQDYPVLCQMFQHHMEFRKVSQDVQPTHPELSPERRRELEALGYLETE